MSSLCLRCLPSHSEALWNLSSRDMLLCEGKWVSLRDHDESSCSWFSVSCGEAYYFQHQATVKSIRENQLNPLSACSYEFETGCLLLASPIISRHKNKHLQLQCRVPIAIFQEPSSVVCQSFPNCLFWTFLGTELVRNRLLWPSSSSHLSAICSNS